ncbi:uracil-DNA glycosylase family protein [Actibacterium lipolyticum]|uniref:Uracil DNA glycosylase superfamily protein n=1 Tax=Actibacterium lipolyticum TaxID=1524263 RepID=A0A238JLC9_9RHOB|nr:uracil-DNA glycosylase family protein [Actibacterium lipolyticum]SMX31451.1 Uracil DNA glycosylase superfamily protein [Actibacterium lipolyticum]
MSAPLETLKTELSACALCADRFAQTATAHRPRPVLWFQPGARILVAGQAPGMRVHKAGKPFFDPSGDRLRDWMGLDEAQFYDQSRVAVLPMAFCFPGYDAKGADLPPPKICTTTWHDRIVPELGDVPLTLLIGGYAQKYFLKAGAKGGVTRTVDRWREHAPRVFPLPHPSWRNTGWLKKNPWFASELLPELRARVKEVMDD